MLNNLSIFFTPLLLLYIFYRAFRADQAGRDRRKKP